MPNVARLIASVWNYRQFIIGSIKTDIAGRLARSRWGMAWMVLQPLVQSLVVALVLSHVLASKLPGNGSPYGYAVYLLIGTLVWSLFQELINRSLTMFIDYGNLMKKIAFPRVCIPLIVVGSSLVHHALLLCAVCIVFACLGHWPAINWFFLLPLLPLTLMLALGPGLVIGVLNVFVRDVAQATPIVLQFLFWVSPIIWTPQSLPDSFQSVLAINPLFPLLVAYHDVLLFNRAPDFFSLWPSFCFAIGGAGLGWFLYQRAKAELTDVL
ncbi:MAG: ABC transporter permease [Betaproteobacteria bacterium]|nr:ABC transporter permease [Betaproteobacteria bacterium]